MRFILTLLFIALDIGAVLILWREFDAIPLSSRVLWSLGVVIIPLISFASWFILTASLREQGGERLGQ